MIRIVVVDDEPLAREELTRLILTDPCFEVVGEAANGEEALVKLRELKPDVVFLDIEMPLMSGLEVASELIGWENPPRAVFATAFDQYAIEAFDANAIDYILKPYADDRLKETLERIKKVVESKVSPKEGLESLEHDLIQKGKLKKIIGHRRNSKDRIVIDADEVFYFHIHYADVLACLGRDELIVNVTLKELLSIIDSEKFSQCHKSHIVNIDKVEKVAPMFSGNFELTLKHSDLKPIPLSRRYAKDLKDRLGGW